MNFYFPKIFGTLWSSGQLGIQIKCIIWIRPKFQLMNFSDVENEKVYSIG
jgi:hypothetical protein